MNPSDFKLKKQNQSKICVLTCYDYPSAQIIAQTNVDCVLVGDTLSMVVHGHSSTIPATMDMMVLHTQAVARGLGKQFLISDMPFLCHRVSLADTVMNVRRLLQAGAQAVKIEGGDPHACETIAHLTQSGVPVMGHLGLTPQSSLQLGYRIQGKGPDQAEALLNQAKLIEAAGCFALVLECIPSKLAKHITQNLSIPTIGIGAGSDTDGQVLVWHDMLGLQTELQPRFVKQFAQGKQLFISAIENYVEQVQHTHFPAEEHCY